MRSELLVKLALLSRGGTDPGDLLRAQRRQLMPVAEELACQLRAATGFDRSLTLWRYGSVCATLRFIDALLAAPPAPRAESAHATASR